MGNPCITSIERHGIKQGIEQGKKQGELAVLKRLLTKRFGHLPDWAEQRLEQAETAALEDWAERVMDAEALEEVFDGTGP